MPSQQCPSTSKKGKIYQKMKFMQFSYAEIACNIDFTENYDIIIMGKDEGGVFALMLCTFRMFNFSMFPR